MAREEKASSSAVGRKPGGRLNVAYVPKGNATGGTIASTAQLRAAGARFTLGTEAQRGAPEVKRSQPPASMPTWGSGPKN